MENKSNARSMVCGVQPLQGQAVDDAPVSHASGILLAASMSTTSHGTPGTTSKNKMELVHDQYAPGAPAAPQMPPDHSAALG